VAAVVAAVVVVVVVVAVRRAEPLAPRVAQLAVPELRVAQLPLRRSSAVVVAAAT
jgi:hypothetical protein